jgi:tRNA (cmo5U34)-methyltransferase
MLENRKHFPADPNKFQFDSEVAVVFPDMARRSIPLYEEMHELHADYLMHRIREASLSSPFSILDIGASRCGFLARVMVGAYLQFKKWRPPGVSYSACDASESMVKESLEDEMLAENLDYIVADVSDPAPFYEGRKFDCVAMHYVMQFIPPAKRHFVWSTISNLVNPGGILLFGEKNHIEDPAMESVMHEIYMRFRRGHGYSIEEIEAKTRALKNSMWPATRQETDTDLFWAGFSSPIVTTCSGQFRSFVARKR